MTEDEVDSEMLKNGECGSTVVVVNESIIAIDRAKLARTGTTSTIN